MRESPAGGRQRICRNGKPVCLAAPRSRRQRLSPDLPSQRHFHLHFYVLDYFIMFPMNFEVDYFLIERIQSRRVVEQNIS